jgi:hypothetical protein
VAPCREETAGGGTGRPAPNNRHVAALPSRHSTARLF